MSNGFRARLRRFVDRLNGPLEIELIDVPLPELPAAMVGFRLAILSDLHFTTPSPFHERLLDAVTAMNPGAILIPGDTTDSGTPDIARLTEFFAPLARIAPTIAILGNNDCYRERVDILRDMYRKSGVFLLENETRLMMANGLPLKITGLTDPTAARRGIESPKEKKGERLAIERALEPQRDDASGTLLPSILLLHKPHLAEAQAVGGPSLIVSGHAHGGQVRLPMIGGLFAPGQGLFPRLTSGLYRVGGTHLLVSRGLGSHTVMPRLWNRPHMPIAVLTKGDFV